jgi:hypothetical protein
MDMQRSMLIYLFISMLVDREKNPGIYKMEVVIKKKKIEKVRLENEVIISEIVFGMVHG